MISVEDQIRGAFRELGIEHETLWACEYVAANTHDFSTAETLAQNIIVRRRRAEPLAYILGEWPFMNVNLKVGPGVLIPRPETEELAEKMVAMIGASDQHAALSTLRILDLGAGSGALGIGVASEVLRALPKIRVELHAVERSADAQSLLHVNLTALQLAHPQRITTKLLFQSWNELTADLREVDVILGNPPYVSEDEWQVDVDKSVKTFEPRSALTPEAPTAHQKSLAARLDLSERDLGQLALGPLLENLEVAKCRLASGGLVGIEVGPSQAGALAPEMLSRIELKFKLTLAVVRDLSSKSRFLIGYKNG